MNKKHLVIVEGISKRNDYETIACELYDDELHKFYKGYELIQTIRNEHSEEIERLNNFLEDYIDDGNLNEEDSKILEWFNDKCIPYGYQIDVVNIHATVYGDINYNRIVKLI